MEHTHDWMIDIFFAAPTFLAAVFLSIKATKVFSYDWVPFVGFLLSWGVLVHAFRNVPAFITLSSRIIGFLFLAMGILLFGLAPFLLYRLGEPWQIWILRGGPQIMPILGIAYTVAFFRERKLDWHWKK